MVKDGDIKVIKFFVVLKTFFLTEAVAVIKGAIINKFLSLNYSGKVNNSLEGGFLFPLTTKLRSQNITIPFTYNYIKHKLIERFLSKKIKHFPSSNKEMKSFILFIIISQILKNNFSKKINHTKHKYVQPFLFFSSELKYRILAVKGSFVYTHLKLSCL